ncbi:hypothetical protein [Streptomyces sp. MP131-18]|uniref:hypothetical protein n=1 Tax=Streptomyces sp. MP131-18 TaxID=1857892 RepID=UPI00097C7255|nr:hypothetical protein [Streptomyces sp. MP131-18]ONK14434.1 hypothetical protein STBA_52190 [Streptomyces sp. MP131-18]
MQHAPLTDTTELARELRLLSDEELLALRRAELRGLADDLEHDRNLAEWAEIDLLQAFARQESMAPAAPAPARRGALGTLRHLLSPAFRQGLKGRPAGQLLRDAVAAVRRRRVRDDLLEAALGILVFVPLLITWYGLREAGRAYDELAGEDPEEATRPFLQLWQSGFDGRVSTLGEFDNVALMAVLLISLLVLLAIWHARVRSRTEREWDAQQTERERLMGRLTSVLTRTQLALSGQRLSTPRQFTGELSKAAGRLGTLVRRATDGQQALATATTAAHDATTELRAAAQRIVDAATPLGAATVRLEAAVQSGQAETTRVSSANAAEVRDVGERITRMGQQIEAALTELTTVQRELTATTQAAAQASHEAAEAVTHSAARTDDAVLGMREAAERWDVAAAHWQDAAARVDTGVRELTGRPPGFGGVPSQQGAGR